MKRLQFRHHNEIFNDRQSALDFFTNILNPYHVDNEKFGNSLFAEPMVVKYKDNEGNVQVIFALGVDSPNTPYHLIDSKDILERIKVNGDKITNEEARAKAAEAILNEKINNEQNRAEEAENTLNTKIDENLTEIIAVTPSSTNVLEEYALKNAKNEILGEHIKIYKDSSLVSAKIAYKGANGVKQLEDGSFEFSYGKDIDTNQEYFYLIYRNENGELNIVGIDFENFLMEAEFGDGIKVVDHVASIKIKEGEKYLKTSKDGLYTINIDESITRLEGAIVNEANRAIDAENKIISEVKSNKIESKDVVLTPTESGGTSLTIQTDEVTITKLASASTIYDTSVAILGSLLKVKKVEPTSTSVKSRYELQGADGKLIGDPIELAVESALIDVKQGKVGDRIDPETGNYILEGDGDTTINFVYRLENGTYELVQIVVSNYFTDAHFGRGLNNQDGVISLKEGGSNEYLVIEENTIEVVGVNAAINKAKQDAINESVNNSTIYTNNKISDLTTHVNTSVDSVIEALNQSISSNIDTLNQTIDAERTRAEIVEQHLSERIDIEISDRIKEISRLEVALNQEIIDRNTADNETIELAKTEAKNVAIEEVAKIVDGADSSFDTLKEIAEWIANDTTGSVQMANDITTLKANVSTLNGNKEQAGSVLHTASDVVDSKLIYNTLPVITITPEDAKEQTLLRHILLENGEKYYYVPNRATEMLYESATGTLINLNKYITDLNDYITDLENKVIKLEARINNIEENGTGTSVSPEEVKNIIKEYLSGVKNEIKVEANDDNSKLSIGFADDAIFG